MMFVCLSGHGGHIHLFSDLFVCSITYIISDASAYLKHWKSIKFLCTV